MRSFVFFIGLCAATSAEAATLRPVTTLHGPSVRLRDLFDNPGLDGDRVLGPGPAPGGRIVVEAPQLGAIARQFEVDWRPASAADRAVLERPGQPLARDDALAALRSALVGAGASPDCVIELAGFVPPLIPLGAVPRPLVSQLDYDSRTGRFSALLSVAGDGMEPLAVRMAGQVDSMVELPLAAARLLPGAIMRPEDVRIGRVSAASLRGEVIHGLHQIIGQQLTRPMVPGQPLTPADLTQPVLVKRGAIVRLRLESGGLAVTGQGVALESGAAGDRIKLRNPGSRNLLEGVVIGPDLVRVAPGAHMMAVEARGDGVAAP